MVNRRSRRWLVALVAPLAFFAVLSPASATVTATYGSLTVGAAAVTACSPSTCMSTSTVFKSNGAVATVVTVSVTLYRTKATGGTAASPSTDYVIKSVSSSYSTTKGVSKSWTLSVSQKCATVATSAYGYYTRTTMTNGTVAGTVSENSAVKQLKGCATV